MRHAVLGSGPDQLSAVSTHFRVAGAFFVEQSPISVKPETLTVVIGSAFSTFGRSDDDDVNQALEEEEENRARKQQE